MAGESDKPAVTKKTIAMTAQPPVVLRVRVRSPAGKGVGKATVTPDVGSPPAAADTVETSGFASFKVAQADIAALSPAGQLVVHVKIRHVGPEPGPGKNIVAGELKLTVTVDKNSFDPATPGL